MSKSILALLLLAADLLSGCLVWIAIGAADYLAAGFFLLLMIAISYLLDADHDAELGGVR